MTEESLLSWMCVCTERNTGYTTDKLPVIHQKSKVIEREMDNLKQVHNLFSQKGRYGKYKLRAILPMKIKQLRFIIKGNL